MGADIRRALDNPEKFYWNVLLEEDDESKAIQYSDSCIFLSVLLFLVSNRDIDGQIIDNYLKRYKYPIEKELNTTKESENKNDKNLIQFCEKYPIIRDIIYSEEKKALSECFSVEDYINYINFFQNSCREFELYAKYQISLMDSREDLRFDAISEVINSYPNSDLFDIEYFKTLCANINGISICFNGETTEKQRDTVMQILYDSKFEGKLMEFTVSKPLTKLQILKLLQYDENTLQSIISEMNLVGYLRKSETNYLLTILNNITGLSWELPNIEMVNNNEVLSNHKNKIWIENYNESDSSIVTYYALQPIVKTKK